MLDEDTRGRCWLRFLEVEPHTWQLVNGLRWRVYVGGSPRRTVRAGAVAFLWRPVHRSRVLGLVHSSGRIS